MRLPVLLTNARACRICEDALPNEPRPLLQGSAKSRLLIIGQAPGAAAHKTGIPWDDRSGQRLREWLTLTPDEFYNPQTVALMPMGFCYPGTGKSGDLPPRPECAPEWHPKLLKLFKNVQLTIYVGKYAFEQALAQDFNTLTDAVKAHKKLLPTTIALPHPSPRNNIWLKKNPWFTKSTLPALRKRVASILAT